MISYCTRVLYFWIHSDLFKKNLEIRRHEARPRSSETLGRHHCLSYPYLFRVVYLFRKSAADTHINVRHFRHVARGVAAGTVVYPVALLYGNPTLTWRQELSSCGENSTNESKLTFYSTVIYASFEGSDRGL